MALPRESSPESAAEGAGVADPDPCDPAAPPVPGAQVPEAGPPQAADAAPADAEAGPEPGADPDPEPPPPEPPPPEVLEAAVEALVCAAGDVLRPERIRDLLGLASVRPVREALAAIQARWRAADLAIEIEEVAGGVRVVTRPDLGAYVARLGRKPVADRLSRSLLETLSIVAYKQPVGRAEIERIRGVQCGEALRALLDRRLLKVVGRSDQPGRPLLYGTTQRFLVAFGLRELSELPAPGDLRA